MYQEFPPTEDYAFVMTGTSFFSNSRCTEAAKIAKKTVPDCYRYTFGQHFQDTQVLRSTERLGTLRIWEEPDDKGYYVIGADPAYGSSDWADRFCIQVYRCYADGLDQVAEFATSEMNTYQFAWVIAHLAGAYKNSTLNVEVNGPGQNVIAEIRRLRTLATSMTNQMGKDLRDVLGSMQNYIWRKLDNMGGLSQSIGFMTTSQTKERMMNYMKDFFERGMMNVYSMDLLEEMKTIVREDGFLGAPGRSKDDRVIASALATVAWAEQVQPRLITNYITREKQFKDSETSNQDLYVGKVAANYLAKIGMRQ